MNAISSTDLRTWADSNGDFSIYNANGTVQLNELGPTGNVNFGTPIISTSFDDDVLKGWSKRGYSWETDLSIQHELLPRMSVSALYYRRSTGNTRVTDDRTLTSNSYDGPFCVTAPTTDARLSNAGQQVCGLYDIKPAFRANSGTNSLVTFANTLGLVRVDVSSGVELNVNARLPKGAFVSGGVSFANRHQNNCDVVDNPEGTRFCDQDSGYRPDIKINGSYGLPLDVQVSATYRALAGPQIAAVWAVPNTLVQAALGRSLAACPATGTPSDQVGVALEPAPSSSRCAKHSTPRLSKRAQQLPVPGERGRPGQRQRRPDRQYHVSTTTSSWLNATGVQDPRQFQISMQFEF
jgi:hypothetical protein